MTRRRRKPFRRLIFVAVAGVALFALGWAAYLAWAVTSEFDRRGLIEDRVGHGFAHAHARDLRDHIVEALDVLDVERGIDVDAVVQQLFHVEIALGMAASRRIRVGELIDQCDLRMALVRPGGAS